MCIHTYIYTHTYIHAHTHTYIHTLSGCDRNAKQKHKDRKKCAPELRSTEHRYVHKHHSHYTCTAKGTIRGIKYLSEYMEEERSKTYKIGHSAICLRPHGQPSTSPI